MFALENCPYIFTIPLKDNDTKGLVVVTFGGDYLDMIGEIYGVIT